MMNNNLNNGGNFIMANNTINSLQVFAGIIKEAFTSVYSDNKVFVREVKKNNGLVLIGLTICERNINIAPTIYLDTYFAQYKDGRAIAERIAADYYEELLPDLQYMIEDSFLAGLDEQHVGIRLRDTLSESISFTLLSACGADMEEYGSEFSFDFIHEFNSMDTLAVLGDAANELAKPVLLETGII